MNKVIWIIQVITALAFTASGGMKLAKPSADLRSDPRMGWASGFSDRDIKAIGTAEVLGAVGLIVPAATGVLPILTPLAGAGLAALMGGAVSTHLQRNEPPVAPAILGLLALAAGALRWRQSRKSRAPRPLNERVAQA